MAKTGKSKVNKSKAIRDAYHELGNVKPKQIQAHLAKKNIKVSTGLISNVRYMMLHKGEPASERGLATARANGDQISVSALLEAKRLVAKAGGVNEAKRVLDTLAKVSV